MSNFRVVVWGNTEQESSASINVPVVDTLPQNGVAGGDQDSLLAALDALSIGTFGESSMNTKAKHANGSTVRPADTEAQKEKRYRVAYVDDSNGKKYSFEIPCADLSLLPNGSEFLDLTAGAPQTLKTFLDTHGVSELGNDITLTSIQFVVR